MDNKVPAPATGRLLHESGWKISRRVIGALLLRELLTRFVDGLNEVAGYEAYALTMPDSESECAEISVA